ncbi:MULTISPECIES: DMT family transporter [Halocynthiibacter]|uniref:DMT family transporter n=1 Tax=Halocynthiibacter halioticoli TaxID=2986804 RepID=A0AAE3J153_9RHOB|nr:MULTISPECIES: DMT family transporter [Halocynthiibacter]MCV6826057.1 DMT family transporter [Halocynthiibacter halioticoli]MCW4059058.1 DMT family transporter [Halocynthiibacter sp. SDUM655004]
MTVETTQRENLQGVGMMTASMAGFAINDAFMKLVLENVPFYQAIVLRGLAVTFMLVLIGLYLRKLDFRLSRRDGKLVLWRCVGEVGATYFFITALIHMPIANVTAVLQSLPLTVTLAGAVFMKEPLGWRRFSAIVAGFMGVLLIVRPGADFDVYALYALGAVACVTLRDLSSRRLPGHISTWTVSVFAAISVTLFGLVGSLFEPWEPVSASSFGLLAGATLCLIGAYVFSVSSMRTGTLAVVTPFRYTGILWAIILGVVVFGDWPDTLTIIGIIIVVGSGLVTLYREQVMLRRKIDSRVTRI